MTRSRVCLFLAVVSFHLVAHHPRLLRAADPLHRQIDVLVESHPGFQQAAATPTDDASFARRVHLDLVGSIPAVDPLREFLADESPEKRTKLIDRLLDSPQYARRMQCLFDVMLMERRAGKHIAIDQWQAYLRESFAQNKSWLELSREILTADGTDERTRPAARFLLDRELNVDSMTRDIGRIFLGRDLQCAQCHDHPVIDDYLQRHYYGLAAFLKRSYLFKDAKTKQSSIGEKAEGEVEFTSVFTSETEATPPRMLDAPPIVDPEGGEELYKIKPEKNVRSVPVYSRRLRLAESLVDPTNEAFRLNIVNRMWAMMMGRGLVEPLDMWHSQNPPTHPELLKLLADAFLDSGYDLKYLLRELARTDTYQRSSQQAIPNVEQDSANRAVDYSVARLKPLSPEQLAWSMMQASGVADQQLQTLIAKQEKTEEKSLASDPSWQDQALTKSLQSNIDVFVKVFGREGVQNGRFDASADQALFLRNGDLLQRWVTQKNGLADQLTALENGAIAERFYLSIFSRMPSPEEAKSIEDFLMQSQDRQADLQYLVWAGLVSTEFRFNH